MGNPIDPELAEYLFYDPKTGNVIWAKNRGGTANAGSVAGHMFSNKGGGVYRRIKFRGRHYFAHRVAWYLFHGEDRSDLDHADKDGTNNRINNLRTATRSQQAANRRGSGASAKGVNRVRSGKFTAQIVVNKVKRHLGTFATEEAASIAYQTVAREAFGEFASF